MRAPGSRSIFTVLAISAMRGPQNGWLGASHFSEFMHAFRAACMHVNGIFSQPASQLHAILGQAVGSWAATRTAAHPYAPTVSSSIESAMHMRFECSRLFQPGLKGPKTASLTLGYKNSRAVHELNKNEFNTVQLKIQSTKRNNSLGYSVGGYPLTPAADHSDKDLYCFSGSCTKFTYSCSARQIIMSFFSRFSV